MWVRPPQVVTEVVSVDVGNVEAVCAALATDGAVVVTGSETAEMVEMMDGVLANARPTGRFQNARFVECVVAIRRCSFPNVPQGSPGNPRLCPRAVCRGPFAPQPSHLCCGIPSWAARSPPTARSSPSVLL